MARSQITALLSNFRFDQSVPPLVTLTEPSNYKMRIQMHGVYIQNCLKKNLCVIETELYEPLIRDPDTHVRLCVDEQDQVQDARPGSFQTCEKSLQIYTPFEVRAFYKLR